MDKKILTTGALTIALVIGGVGGLSLNSLQANAADTATPTTTSTSQTPSVKDGQFDKSHGGHVGANGKKEELLTGDTAEKVKAAALAAVSGGSIDRVETDAEGAAYEAHMTKSDGSHVTVKLDSSFKVTGTESGMH